MTAENSVLRLQWHLQVEVSEQVKLRQIQIKDFYYSIKKSFKEFAVPWENTNQIMFCRSNIRPQKLTQTNGKL